MLDNAPFTELVRQSFNCAIGLGARKVMKEELFLEERGLQAASESRNQLRLAGTIDCGS